jgi:sialidase-1
MNPPVATEGVSRLEMLPASAENPRNSEGDFMQLKDGRLVFIYSHFAGNGQDDSSTHLAARYSSDGGRSWTAKDEVIVANEGKQNVMSVSLLRLADGRIALFYGRKESLSDGRPYMRISADEGRTWGPAILCITDEVAGYNLNNARAIQLKSGRILLPIARHTRAGESKLEWPGTLMTYYSDDTGVTWRRSQSEFDGRSSDGTRITFQEPGLIELKDGRLMMYARTNQGFQYASYSSDGGDHWSDPVVTSIISPLSPALIKRIPKTGDLLLVWNNNVNSHPTDYPAHDRSPLNVALSRDDGRTWKNIKTLEHDPNGAFCYPSVAFVGGEVLVAFSKSPTKKWTSMSAIQIDRFSLDWLYNHKGPEQ